MAKYTPLTLSPINFSLTDGTSIPAPPASPPLTPRLPTPNKGPLSSHPTAAAATMPGAYPPTPSATNGLDPLATVPSTSSGPGSPTSQPLSPTLSKQRPGSVRKFLGLRTLGSSDSLRSVGAERPGSPDTRSSGGTRKKSGGWFGRRRSAMFARSGMVVEQVTVVGRVEPVKEKKAQVVRMGPPPPALPELKSLGVEEEAVSLGAEEMFKDIK
ncbi:hypothetical protein V2W45_1231620 [Cenococcum geophilum]